MYSHIAGIDLDQPVYGQELLRAGTKLVQYQFSGQGMGQYFSYPDADPMKLGILMQMPDPKTGKIIKREKRNYSVIEDIEVLKTVAQEMPASPYGVGGPGGETQLFIPKHLHKFIH